MRSRNDSVTVLTETGSYTGREVIVTVSVGVLKSGIIAFDPPLPKWKTTALDTIRMATYVKVFAAWPDKWWTEADFETYGGMAWVVLLDSGEAGDQWKIFTPMPTDAAMLQFSAIDKEGKRIERLSDSQLKAEIAAKLGKAFPYKTIPEPSFVKMTDWSSNELYQGAYSFQEVVPEGVDIDDIRWPIKNDRPGGGIWFAGEAMSSRYGGYMHAAYHSGTEVATQIREAYGIAFAIGIKYSKLLAAAAIIANLIT